MTKLGKLRKNPRLFLRDVRLLRWARHAAELARGPRRQVVLDEGPGGVSARLRAAVLSGSPAFTVDSVHGGDGADAGELSCWVTDVAHVLSAALIAAERLGAELHVHDAEGQVRAHRLGLSGLAVRADRSRRIDLAFRRGPSVLAVLAVSIWERQPASGTVRCRDEPMFPRALSVLDFERAYDEERRHLGYRTLLAVPIDEEALFEVDVVYTWVNDRDPAWRQMLSRYRELSEVDWDRYTSVDELRYSLRSVARFAPWVRNIYVVTNCAPPPWFRPGGKLSFVPHEAVFPDPATQLPTFNSHAIEACLLRVPGLAEHFVYFNDDMFLARPLQKTDFFTSNGCSVSHLEPYGMVMGEPSAERPDYMNAAANGAARIARDFGRWPTRLHQHVPYALKRSVLLEMERAYPEDFARVRGSRFRSPEDLSVTSFFYHHYAYQRREAVRGVCNSRLLRGARFREGVAELRGPHEVSFFCMNDGEASARDPGYLAVKQAFLPELFPDPAPWELPDAPAAP